MKLFRSLPQELQDEKWIAWMGLIVSVGLDEAIYLQEIERFMKLFPDDPGLDLLTLGHWESKREWKRGLECLERFDHFIGGDPYLNTYRTIFLIKLGRTTEAKVSARQLLAAEPKLEGSFYTMAYYLVMGFDT